MRPLTIDLDALALAMNSRSEAFYLDLHSGRVLPLLDAPELEQALEEEPQRYLAIEALEPRDALHMMEDFLAGVVHPHAYTALEHALSGRKPFRAFHHALAEYPEVGQDWLVFEGECLRERALDWLAEHELQPSANR
ncbi:hypothetical protein D9M68_293030 [compost metagenome]